MPDRKTKRLKTAIAGALAPVMEREAGQAGPHPEIDDLICYHGGELDEAAEQRMRDHLVACSDCLDTLLDLDGFVGAGGGRTEGARSAGPGWRVALAVAASLLVVVSGLAVWLVQERRATGDLRLQVARLSAPRPDVPIVDLLPDSTVRSESGGPPRPELTPGDDYVTFVLSLPQATELTDFEVEIVAPGGGVTWSGPVERRPYGDFTLGLWRRNLAPGENAIRLYGREDGRRRLLETYTFRVGPREEDS